MPAILWKILRTTLPAVGCFLLALLAFQPPQAVAKPVPFHPIIVDLGATCGRESFATGVNNDGVVAGNCNVPGTTSDFVWHGGLWHDGAWTDLPVLDEAANGGFSEAYAVNDDGLVAGSSVTPTMSSHATLWTNGVISDLGTLGGVDSRAFAVNNHGQVVGSSTATPYDLYAFLWENGTMTQLATRSSIARAINDHGVVAGAIRVAALYDHAAIWHMGAMTDLGTLGGPASTAAAINERSQVVGASSSAAATQTHAFLWDNGVMTDLGDLGSPGSYEHSMAFGINELGQVVGAGGPPGKENRAFFWADGTMLPLPSLGGPDTGQGCAANAINDRGIAVGYCIAPSGFMHAVLWDLWDNTTLYLPAIAR